MKKPGPNYKMSKANKIDLAVNWHRPGLAARKRTIIEGELYGREVVKAKRERDN